MPPKQTNVEPSDEPWLVFRRKHDVELNDLQQQAKRSYEKFQQNVNKAKADLLARHKKEEEEFWSRAQAASKDKNKSKNKSALSGAGTHGQTDRREAAPTPRTAAPEVKRTQAAISKAPQTPTPTPAYNTTTQACQSRMKSEAVTIIDLCSDDDEPVQEQKKLAPPPVAKDPMLGSQKSDVIEPALRRRYAIPLASFGLFGRSTNRGTPEPSQFKRKHSVPTRQSPTPVTPSPIASHNASTAALPTEQSPIPKGSAWAFGAPVSKGLGITSAHTHPTISRWATPTISAAEGVQLSSGFAPSRLSLYHQPGSSQSQQNVGHGQGQPLMAQESAFQELPLDDADILKCSVATSQDEHKKKPVLQPLKPNTEDMLMHRAPQTPPRSPQYIPNMPPLPGPSPRTPDAQPPSPMTLTGSSFRRPELPASATKESIPAARNVRAGSQASVSTYCASSITQSQRDSSVTSRTSVSSLRSSRVKRKVVDLSSDEESDYAPPSEDDKPVSPITGDDVSKSKKSSTKPATRPVTKKVKLPSPLPSAIVSKGVVNKGKNGFGSQPPTKPKPIVNQAAVSLPNPPPLVSIKKLQPSALFTPTNSTPASKKFMRPTATTRVASISRSPRKAKLDASAKISQLSETELQTRNNITIDEANKYEAPETGVVERVRGSLRSMSITPAPSNVGDHGTAAEDVEMLADLSDPESTIVVQSTKHGAGWNLWTRSRANGDRQLAKSRPNRPLVQDDAEGDSDEDPDISKYSIVDGVILHEADLECARLTKGQGKRNLMNSRETIGGSHVRVVSAVEILKRSPTRQSERVTRGDMREE